MGRKGGWFHAVKRAISYPQKDKKDQIFSSENINLDSIPSHEKVSPPLATNKEAKTVEIEVEDEDEWNTHAYSIAVATARAAKAAAEAAQAAAEVVRLTSRARSMGKTKEETSAIKIQTAYRGYLARKSLRAMRGNAKLKSFVEGISAKRQAANTLRCMQTLARVQSQIHARRIRMSEENQALMRQLQLKHERENDNMGETWDDTRRTKEQIETNLMNKQEAEMRRERALAYAFTQQRTHSPNGSNTTPFMDPKNPEWGWSWLEKWMATRPWESRSDSVKGFRALSLAGEINRTNSLQDDTNNVDDGTKEPSDGAKRLSQSPARVSATGQSEKQRRHSIGGIKKMASSPGRIGVMEYQKQNSAGYAKRRLSLSGSSPGGPRRHSIGGKVETTTPTTVKDSKRISGSRKAENIKVEHIK